MKEEVLYWIVILLPIVIEVLLVIFACVRNRFVLKMKKVERNKSVVDVFLKKRFDLIPNLVEVCKGYAKFEKDILTRIIELRSIFNSNPNDHNETNLRVEYQKLIGLVESYPDLKASQSFLDLQKEIVNVENELQAARRMYINSITDYNNTVLKIPNSLIAIMTGYRPIELPRFDYDEIKVEF